MTVMTALEEVALALRGAANNGYDDLPSPTFRLCTKHTLQGVQPMGKRGEGTFLTFFVYSDGFYLSRFGPVGTLSVSFLIYIIRTSQTSNVG